MVIHSFFIISKSGMNVFHKNYDSDIDVDLSASMLCAFFSAMNSFSKNIFERGLDSVIVRDKKFVCEDTGDFLSIALIDSIDNTTFMRKKLQGINEFLVQNYSKELENFDGDLEAFKPLEETIDNIILNDLHTSADEKEMISMLSDLLKKLKAPRKKGQKASIIKMIEENIDYFERRF